jgi:hypothetical protein
VECQFSGGMATRAVVVLKWMPELAVIIGCSTSQRTCHNFATSTNHGNATLAIAPTPCSPISDVVARDPRIV